MGKKGNIETPTSLGGSLKGLTCLAARSGGVALVSWLACGCAAGDGEQLYEVGQARQAVENGEVNPSIMNGGVVELTIGAMARDQQDNVCTAQVISRDTLLTAAHCFYDVSYYADGWQQAVPASIYVRHQNPDGSWENLTSNKENATVYVREEYDTLRASNSTQRWGADIAVVRLGRNWLNIQSSDVAALPRYHDEHPPGRLWLYGYGFHTDTQNDEHLRRGELHDLSWNSTSGFQWFRTVVSYYGDSDPHSCKGDSGGPWKTATMYYSGVQYGVHVRGHGSGYCTEDGARAAMVAHHDDWIEQKVETGAGSCWRETLPIQPHGMNIEQVRAKVCW